MKRDGSRSVELVMVHESFAKFLEEYPLYRKFGFEAPNDVKDLPRPSIQMDCDACQSARTFVTTRKPQNAPFFKSSPLPPISPAKAIHTFSYQCAYCKSSREFYLQFSSDLDYVMKVGQFPPWSIEPPTEAKGAIGREHLPEFKKGLICESQGYGIGAFAYYRRIVENTIDTLLEDIASLLETSACREQYHKKLSDVRESRIAADKIEVVKDLLPENLRPGGVNPLSTLHIALSDGIHSRSDEECLDLAGMVRTSLIFLLQQVRSRKEQGDVYARDIHALQEKRSRSKDS